MTYTGISTFLTIPLLPGYLIRETGNPFSPCVVPSHLCCRVDPQAAGPGNLSSTTDRQRMTAGY